jgi:hypothetical protein
MRKTPTIFDRDWEGNRRVVPKLLHNPVVLGPPTEKLDGTNVRVTVRSGVAVRLEARQNPTKTQKQGGIEEPWYRDAWRDPGDPPQPHDKYIYDALQSANLTHVPDGEWSAEAVGPKIQGNPLKLDEHRLYFFDRSLRIHADIPTVPLLPMVPPAPSVDWGDHRTSPEEDKTFFDAIHEYLLSAHSAINPEVGIEGIVWHGTTSMAKIKLKDFKP